jgi:hypothetical protein
VTGGKPGEGKPRPAQPDIRLREAIAVYLYGKGYTDTQLKGIAILGKGRWYRYPHSGTYIRIGNQITISMSGRKAETFQ